MWVCSGIMRDNWGKDAHVNMRQSIAVQFSHIVGERSHFVLIMFKVPIRFLGLIRLTLFVTIYYIFPYDRFIY